VTLEPSFLQCPYCPVAWETPAIRDEVGKVGAEIARHVRDLHGREELALTFERTVIHC